MIEELLHPAELARCNYVDWLAPDTPPLMIAEGMNGEPSTWPAISQDTDRSRFETMHVGYLVGPAGR